MDNELEDRLEVDWLHLLMARERSQAWRRYMSNIQYDIINRYAGRHIQYRSSVIVRMTNLG